MDRRIVEIEADSLDEAKKEAETQVPQDFSIISEEVLSDGKLSSAMASRMPQKPHLKKQKANFLLEWKF